MKLVTMQRPGIYYYFQVGRATQEQPARYIGAGGNLVVGDADVSALRTFASVTEAGKLFDLMHGRYASLPLVLRSHSPDFEL